MIEIFGIGLNWLHALLAILWAVTYMDRLYYKDIVNETIEDLEQINERLKGEREG